MFPAQEEADRTVFVGNLEARVREEILYELFLQAGPLTKVTLCKDRDGKPKSFGFVCFKHPESVSYAIALLNGIRLYGRPINVQYRFGTMKWRAGLPFLCRFSQLRVPPYLKSIFSFKKCHGTHTVQCCNRLSVRCQPHFPTVCLGLAP
ncbi:splicing regulator RBM11 isoform 2 [Mus musculus]|uniref:splicing regulator RBM11 isoform 2 n=1 Tax=Mus musculus TaxID=10090 RepID=UPI0003D71F61|nr:splicing regulator RBM11 isoform 2 [Mus musculus]